MKNYSTIITFILLLNSFLLHGQDIKRIDSLKQVLKTTMPDSARISVLYNLAEEYYLSNPDTAIIICNQGLLLAEKIQYKLGLADGNGWLGYLIEQKGDIPKAIEHFSKCYKIQEELGDKSGMAITLNNIGAIFQNKGDIPQALECLGKSLKIYESLGNKQGMAASLNNIANIYRNHDDIQKALEYFEKSLKMREETDDKQGIANSLSNIGMIYYKQGNIFKTLEYLHKSLKIKEEIQDIKGMASSFHNLGRIYQGLGDIQKALEYYGKSLKIKEDIGDKQGIASSLHNIGMIYFNQNNIQEANIFAEKSYKLSKELGYPDNIQMAAELLKSINKKMGNYKKAFEYYEEELIMKDSINNKENYKKIQKQQAKYEYEKKAVTDSIAHEKAIEIKNIEVKKQKIINTFVIIGLILTLIIAFIIWRSLRITRKQKRTIENQKHEIEEQRDLVSKQKEHIEHIYGEQTDSIRYAEKIQKAVLPLSESTKIMLGEHFILFKPKDIVSGDFYYVGKRNNTILISVADCTGHGVPGAFMSMLGVSFLNEIIAKEEIKTAGSVLDELRQYVIQSLQQKGVQGEQQDGMDMGFCAINTETLEMQFAGANNPCWIVTSKQEAVDSQQLIANGQLLDRVSELVELKPDKQPIGIYSNMQPFSNQKYQLQKEDIVYLMSDGFFDQFDGENKKKFMSKRLKELLLSIAHLPMTEQQVILNDTFENWKGNGEQIDDVTVMGIRI